MRTPEEIRQRPCSPENTWFREIAAQLAELNQNLKARNPEAHMPEECQRHECSYFTHYLVYGGPDLTHEGFHHAERQALNHFANCPRSKKGDECQVCSNWETRVRA